MVVPLTVEQYERGGEQYYRYYTPQVGHRYAEGSFAAEGISPEQARQIAAQKSAKYLNVPIYDISGFEAQAPSPEAVGIATTARQEQYVASRANIAALYQQREQLQRGFGGTFTPYTEYVARREIGEMVASQKQYAQIQYLKSPTAQWASESVFAEKVAQVAPYAPSGTVFRGQIIQPLPTPPPTQDLTNLPYLPKRESPFAGYQRPASRGKYEGLVTGGLYEKASQFSSGMQARFEKTIGYGEEAHPVIKFVSGFGLAFTGLPAFGGAALVGAEYYAKHPPKSALARTIPVLAAVPGAKKTALELVAQARTKPYETAGMFTGMAISGRGAKVGTPSFKGVKALIKEEKAVSYVPTFERARAEPLAVPKAKVQVMERTKGYVLPSLRGLQVVGETKLKPLTELKVVTETQTKTRVQARPIIALQTRVRVLALPQVRTQTLPATRTQTRALVQTKPMIATKALVATKTLTRIMPSIKVRPMVKTMPAVQTQTLTKTLTQTRTRTKTMPMVSTQVMLRRATKTKLSTGISEYRFKAPAAKGFGKFGEVAKVASAKQILGGKRIRRPLF